MTPVGRQNATKLDIRAVAVLPTSMLYMVGRPLAGTVHTLSEAPVLFWCSPVIRVRSYADHDIAVQYKGARLSNLPALPSSVTHSACQLVVGTKAILLVLRWVLIRLC